MSDRRTSPYLVLGVPFAADSNEAAKGFARAVRRLRKLDDPPFDLEDLNWAQHEIDHREGVVEHSLDDFRVPADPFAYLFPTATRQAQDVVLVLERRTPPTEPTVTDRLRAEAVASLVVESVSRVLTSDTVPALPASFIIKEE